MIDQKISEPLNRKKVKGRIRGLTDKVFTRCLKGKTQRVVLSGKLFEQGISMQLTSVVSHNYCFMNPFLSHFR